MERRFGGTGKDRGAGVGVATYAVVCRERVEAVTAAVADGPVGGYVLEGPGGVSVLFDAPAARGGGPVAERALLHPAMALARRLGDPVALLLSADLRARLCAVPARGGPPLALSWAAEPPLTPDPEARHARLAEWESRAGRIATLLSRPDAAAELATIRNESGPGLEQPTGDALLTRACDALILPGNAIGCSPLLHDPSELDTAIRVNATGPTPRNPGLLNRLRSRDRQAG
ncbi:hypothetical protein G5C51_06100 [Streptomyces sp. A7024]|uniref:Uncharacterized protein n=1 Tax=Streptomyces coryli TaxID=1128680 RepID=A0A6G4TU17_9ACTN|nr:hypothetical protein [Streptomyces coryli]NGN63475.1 hypothetical protein [Streptomyces coryli]